MRKTLIVAVLLFACSKKKEPEPQAAPPAPTPSIVASAASSTVAPIASAPPAVIDDAVDSDFTLHEDLVFPEGKQLAIGKIAPATKETVAAHAAAIQTKYEEIVKDGFKQTKRFNASWIPATYIIFEKPAKNDKPAMTKMLEVEGESTNEVALENGSTPYDLWNTPRGYFIDLTGDERLTYFLRAADASGNTCVAKVWNMGTGKVENLDKIPEFVTRGRDVDGDGKNEFPTAIFAYELAGFVHAANPPAETLCNVKFEGKLTIDVVGVDRDGNYRAFYERRLKAAKARAAKPRAAKRKKGALRMTNTCALDAAQAAAEVFVYERLLGTAAEGAIADADSAMKDLSLKPEACEGLTSKDGDAAKDQWPDMRAALMSWKPPAVYEATDAK